MGGEKMGGKIHYFSYYLKNGMEKQRQTFPASLEKIEYIKDSIKNSGKSVILVSTAMANPGIGYLRGQIDSIDEFETQVYFSTFKFKNRLINKVSVLYMTLQIILYTLFKVDKDDEVLIYHSLSYILPFNFIKKIKRIKIVLEFNDLYHTTSKKLFKYKEKEIKFIESVDKYLFMNDIAADSFNNKKPYILSYGNYKNPQKRVVKFADGKIHVVYAGIIEDTRKAARLAAEAAIYLNEKFTVHILGFGNEEQVNNLRELVSDINFKKGYEAVIFHGRLRGQDFSDFLHSCHIGISSHSYLPSEKDSANYTFPSKIPTYLRHGLCVVSPNIPCVVRSPFAEFIHFYQDHNGSDIAKTIENISFTTSKRLPTDLIIELDENFVNDIKFMLI